MNKTALRIQRRWAGVKDITDGSITIGTMEGGLGSGRTYSGAEVSANTMDFQGDWRTADSWMRFDMWRVRNRSRQLERGNPMCIGFKRNMINNVLGSRGFHFKVVAKTSKALGDATQDQLDLSANAQIQDYMATQGRAENFTTRKILSRQDADELLLSRWILDGENIIRKQRGFKNDCGFAWQIIDADYLDYNRNRVEPNGNLTKMGVELDSQYKFPVAYWFLKRRPNDLLYNYDQFYQERYIRVPAEEIIHIFLQTDDSEQTRGWPWIFASMVNLNRAGKFQEAALVNAAIGASRGVYFKKTYPDGFAESGADMPDNGKIWQDIPEGSALELPFGVEPVAVDMRYPDQELEPFMNVMNLGIAMGLGTSYSTTTGDLSKANFVSSRLGQLEERELYMRIQGKMIDRWKVPSFDEELYRGLLSGGINLPLSKFDKFNAPKFTGRRWPFVQPVDDITAKEKMINNCVTSISAVIEETGGDPDETFAQIAADNEKLKALGIQRILATPPPEEPDPNDAPGEGKTSTVPPTKKGDGSKKS